jgi:hypothetical protein
VEELVMGLLIIVNSISMFVEFEFQGGIDGCHSSSRDGCFSREFMKVIQTSYPLVMTFTVCDIENGHFS